MDFASVEPLGPAHQPAGVARQAGEQAKNQRRTVRRPESKFLSLDATIVSEFAGKKIVREPVPIERDEPLKLELQSFLDSIRAHRDPLVTGEAAKQALEVAMEITALCGKGIPASTVSSFKS